MSPDELDTALLAAHEAGDRDVLIVLYRAAASAAEHIAARRFFLTQAYVYALEAGAPESAPLRAELVTLGGERAAP